MEGAIPSRRWNDEERVKKIKRYFKIKEKKKYSKDKAQCYKCKGYEHVMHECLSMDKDYDPKAMKVLYTTFESDDEGSEDFLSEICFMVIEKEREEDFVRASKELFVETICMAKKNKNLKEQLEAITKEKYILKEELRSKEEELTQSKDKVQELQQ